MIGWERWSTENNALKFDHTTKWYKHKPESVQENEMHKILLDFEIQMDDQIPARRPDLVLIKKRTCYSSSRPQTKNKSEKINKYLDLARELKKEWRVMVIPGVVSGLGKKTEGTGDQRKNLDHPNQITIS